MVEFVEALTVEDLLVVCEASQVFCVLLVVDFPLMAYPFAPPLLTGLLPPPVEG